MIVHHRPRRRPAAALMVLCVLAAACTDDGAAGDSDSAPATDTAPDIQSCEAFSITRWQEWTQADLPSRGDPSGTQPGGAVGDLDGDGDLDVLLAFGGGAAVFANDGSGTLSIDDRWTLGGGPLPNAVSTAMADLDADGDLDVWFGAAHGEGDHIGWNQGGTDLVDEPLAETDGTPGTGVFADFDGDGDLDLFVSGFVDRLDHDAVEQGTQVGSGTRLFVQQDGAFVDRSTWIPADVAQAISFQGSVLDADLDGDLDVYLSTTIGAQVPPNQLLLNDGTGHFTLSEDCLCNKSMAAMGNGAGDANGDGLMDLYISDFGPPTLLLGDGAGAFTDAGLLMGAAVPGTDDHQSGWATAFADLDRNGCTDLIITYGESCHDCEDFQDSKHQYDQLLLSDCSGGFSRGEPYTPGFDDDERTRAVVIGDLDADGRPDLVTIGKHFLRTWHTGGGCPTGLSLTLVGAGQDPHAIGARVAVEANGRTQTQWVLPSTASSASAFELVFGLAGAPAADRVQVTWPGGQVDVLTEVAAGAHQVHQ